MGDSVTSGFAMTYKKETAVSISEVASKIPLENRGKVFSIGFDRNEETIPNYIKHYNDAIIGGSKLDHRASYCSRIICTPELVRYHPNDGLNSALSGASFVNLEVEMNYLRRKYNDFAENLDEKWKMATIFIGGNDVCKRSCQKNVNIQEEADAYEKSIESVILELKKFGRMIIILLALPDISKLEAVYESSRCKRQTSIAKLICPCIFHSDNSRKLVARMVDEFNIRLLRLSQKFNQVGDSTFGLKYMSFLQDIDANEAFLSEFDCFHPNETAHKVAARKMWNGLFDIDSENLYCPKSSDRIKL